MLRHLKVLLEPFVLSLVGAVVLASSLPARGNFATLVDRAADAGIVLLFFLHGARLSREALLDGASNWRLHLATLATTFVLFPIAGLGFAAVPGLSSPLDQGLLYLTLLPSTVQSAIALTAVAGGNVAAAVCGASISNLVGIFLTPALVGLLLESTGDLHVLESVQRIVVQLLLPFLLGHALRPLLGAFVTRHKALMTIVDRGSILLVVYAAFGAAVVDGLWTRVAPADALLVIVLCVCLFCVILALSWALGRALGFAREDAIVLQFFGSTKSLASGVPMAGVLFPPAAIGGLILPLMLFHQIQLIACAVVARRYAQQLERR